MATITITITITIMATITIMVTPTTTTTTTTGMATSTADANALLQLMWLASPALPVGGFSYSEGLEAAVDAGLVHDRGSATTWLREQATLVLARSELPLLHAAHLAWRQHDAPRIAELNAWALATRESAEFRLQTEQMGRSLLEWHRQGPQAGDARLATLAALVPAPAWPVAFALGTALADAGEREALLAFAFAWCEAMSQAAIKAVPLGQAAARQMLAALVADLPGLVEQALATPDAQRQAFTPLLAIHSARHESQYSRLFRS
jgi:urease accessory protein